MDPTRLAKIMINLKPEGRKKRGRPRRTWKDGICTAISDRDLRMGEWNNRRQWNTEVGRHIYIYIYIYIYISRYFGNLIPIYRALQPRRLKYKQ